jgi:hypothetical protein
LRRDAFADAGVDERFDVGDGVEHAGFVFGLLELGAVGEVGGVVPGCGADVAVFFGVGEDPVEPGEFAVLLELVGNVCEGVSV